MSRTVINDNERELRKDFGIVYEKQIEELLRHVPEKGFTYRDKDFFYPMAEHLKELCYNVAGMISRTGILRSIEYGMAIGDNPDELIDLMNMSAMIYIQLKNNSSEETVNETSSRTIDKQTKRTD